MLRATGHGQNGLGFMGQVLQEGFALGMVLCARVTNPTVPVQPWEPAGAAREGTQGVLCLLLWGSGGEQGMELQKINPEWLGLLFEGCPCHCSVSCH